MHGIQSDSGCYSNPVGVNDALTVQTESSESSHSGRSVFVISPSSSRSEDPPPPYSELFPASLPSYWEATGEWEETGESRVVARCTMTQLANIRAGMRAMNEERDEPFVVLPPQEPAHRRVECLHDAFCRCSLERIARMMLIPTMCLLVCVLIVILVKIYTPSAP